ncbi:MAG: galactose mutarotase [Treponema sp.]|jgi:aldose 1-epimerase|nr:galactose mutarotase [Treponema sp.]
MNISRKKFGVLSNGETVYLYTLEAGDMSLSVSTFGATWTSLFAPGKKGREDLILGHSSLEGYFHGPGYMGATIGRFANRIGGASFTLGGKNYGLYPNDGGHSLHGGRRGFDKKNWEAHSYTDRDGVFVRFELESPPGDEGYPGRLHAAVSYGLTLSGEVVADYRARVDEPCPVNLTNHVYFNLAGEGSGAILSHELRLYASSYVESGPDLIPTGKLIPVAGTAFDFTAPKAIGRDYKAACGGEPERSGAGYDHCFVLDGWKAPVPEVSAGPEKAEPVLHPCAEVREPESGRGFRLFTSQPGVQFYSGNFLDGAPGKAGSVYRKNAGFCLETQRFPDSPNQGSFPPAVFGPGRDYHERALFAFSW